MQPNVQTPKNFSGTPIESLRPRDAGAIDLWDIGDLFRKNLGKIFFSVLLCVGAAIFYLNHTSPVYVS
ncbi:MAG TPA: hypothetical protein VFB55_09605, partial [Verrucomicrobiae bacterium]|nr:hypothetical protein [Verrucomicrobiae bacterium]